VKEHTKTKWVGSINSRGGKRCGRRIRRKRRAIKTMGKMDVGGESGKGGEKGWL
jgi:hypothetical protein